MGWVRELGEGVKRIYEEMELFFLDEPIYEEPHYSVLLTLKNNIITRRQRRVERISALISKEWNNLSNEEKKALELAYGKDKLTTRELAESLSRSGNYARNILNGLVDKGFLFKIASSKTDPNQYYVLADSNEE